MLLSFIKILSSKLHLSQLIIYPPIRNNRLLEQCNAIIQTFEIFLIIDYLSFHTILVINGCNKTDLEKRMVDDLKTFPICILYGRKDCFLGCIHLYNHELFKIFCISLCRYFRSRYLDNSNILNRSNVLDVRLKEEDAVNLLLHIQ